jgi:EAL domain-containing protein (putative c-di-GMP-specific phosphodiesterase class I)
VGICIAPQDGADPDELLKNADMALYRAKQEARGTYRFFETEMDTLMRQRRKMESDLRHALTANEFELHYQPQLNLKTNEISGFEALLRWNHPERSIPPGEFIPLAEEIGLIIPIGKWVLSKACMEAAQWPGSYNIAVNLSPLQFKDPYLVETVQEVLTASGLRPDRLELEITETVLLNDTPAVLATLHQFHDLGVRVSLDDFGTGYSSLSYLRSFPFDKIKIDRSFINDLGPDRNANAIIRAVTGLGASLGMVTTAEGIETVDQLMRVRQEGCTEVQGFLIGRPKPASEIAALIHTPELPARKAVVQSGTLKQ